MRGDGLLQVEGVTKRFGGVTAVHRCSLALQGGKIYGLIGPNGSGKTTLFNCVTGIEQRDEGTIRYKGEQLDGLRPYQIAQRGIGRTFQVIRIFPELTALENLLVVSRQGGIEANRKRAEDLLAFVRLTPLAGEFGGNLSYGQQKLLEFARILMLDPDLVLLDEPAGGVNPTLLADLLEHIRWLPGQGKTVMIVEHNMQVIMGLCEHVFVLDHGELIAQGPPAEIQRNEQVIEAYFGRHYRASAAPVAAGNLRLRRVTAGNLALRAVTYRRLWQQRVTMSCPTRHRRLFP